MLALNEGFDKYIVSDYLNIDNDHIIDMAGLSLCEYYEMINNYNGKIFNSTIEFKNIKDANSFINHIDNLVYANSMRM